MAEAENIEEQVETTKSSGVGGILMMGIIGIIAAGGGFMVPYLYPSLVGAGDPESETPPVAKSPMPKPESDQVFISFGEVVVNLHEGSLNRYLNLDINLQVDKSKELELTEVVTSKKAILKNWLLGYLADKGLDDVRGAAGQNRMRREIQDQFNTVLFPDGFDQIHDVLFEKFNIQ
jgi:flagellar protein FliL